jgi:hypothetical protein
MNANSDIDLSVCQTATNSKKCGSHRKAEMEDIAVSGQF